MNTYDDKDELFYGALSQSIIDIVPEFKGTIHGKRECVRIYKELMDD